jgi:hypothetical protein
MKARSIVMTALGTLALSAQVLGAGSAEWTASAPGARAAPLKVHGARTAAASYIVQGPSFAVTVKAVHRVGGRITHELPIINAVAATLTLVRPGRCGPISA